MTSIEYGDLDSGERLEAGGTATVFKAYWKSRNMDVAIKNVVTNPEDIRKEVSQCSARLLPSC